MGLTFGILGPLEVREDGVERPVGAGRQRALLALLLVHANELVSSERLIDELWSSQPPPSAHKVLQGYVSQLRRALPPETIQTRSPGYVLVATDTDAAEFERLTRRAAEQQADEAINTLQRAFALWRGRAFDEFEYEEWAQVEIARLEGLRLSATEQRIEAELELGHHVQLVPELETLVADHPLRERLRGQLMVALYRSGRQSDALEVYRQGRRVLDDELGLEPSPMLAQLERQILNHDPTLRPEPLHQLDIDGVETEFPPLDAERFVEPRPRRRKLLIGAVAVAVAAVAAATIVLITAGGSGPVLPNSVIRIDPTTLKATQVAQVGEAPDLVIESGGYLWVANKILRDSKSGDIVDTGKHTLTRVDPITGQAVSVGGGLLPCGLAADPSGDVWVANCYPNPAAQPATVVRVGATNLHFKDTWRVPGIGDRFYRGIAYGGGSLWVSDPARSGVFQVDPNTGHRKSIRLPGAPGSPAWSGGYGDVWITAFVEGSITRLHAADGRQEPTDSIATNPASLVVDGSAVWVADWASPQVVRLAAVGPSRPRPVDLPVQHPGCPKYSCVWRIAAGAGFIWATIPEDHALFRIDPKTNAVTRIALPYPPTGVAADADNVWVTVRGRLTPGA